MCSVTNTAAVFTYCDHVGTTDIWCHLATLLELMLQARKSDGLELLFWNSKFSSSIFSWMFAVFQVNVLLDWLIGGRGMH
jgi:hypothetical protein